MKKLRQAILLVLRIVCRNKMTESLSDDEFFRALFAFL